MLQSKIKNKSNDIEIRISRQIGGWEVRINHAAIPVLFASFAEVVKEIPEYVDGCEDCCESLRIRNMELETALYKIINLTDSEMMDGDGARKIAERLVKHGGEQQPVKVTSGLKQGLGALIALGKRAQPLRKRMLSSDHEDWKGLSDDDNTLVNGYVCDCVQLAEGVLAMLEVMGSCTLKLDA